MKTWIPLRLPLLIAKVSAVAMTALALTATCEAAGTIYSNAGGSTTSPTTTSGNWDGVTWTQSGTTSSNVYPNSAGDIAQNLGTTGTTATVTLDVPVTVGGLYVGSQATTLANWTIASDGNASHFFTLDGTGLPLSSTPGAPYAAGVAVIASRSGGTLTVNPNIVMATSLDIGGTSPQTPSGVIINGNITSSATAATAITFRGQGSTTQSSITSAITINGSVGASGGSISLANLRTANAGTTAGTVVVNGNLGPSVTTLTQNSVATMTLTGTNTYSGATTITSGTLQIRGGTAIPNASPVSLGGGMLSIVTSSKEGSGATVSGGTPTGTNAVGLGALSLSANSTLDFDSATNGNVLSFASGFAANGFKLTITNWSSGGFNGSTNSGTGTDDRLIFDQSMSSNLGSFDFGSGSGVGVSQIALGGGYYEIGFAGVPEPSTWAMVLLLIGLLGYHERQRFARLLAH